MQPLPDLRGFSGLCCTQNTLPDLNASIFSLHELGLVGKECAETSHDTAIDASAGYGQIYVLEICALLDMVWKIARGIFDTRSILPWSTKSF